MRQFDDLRTDRDYDFIRISVPGTDYSLTASRFVRNRRTLLVLGSSDHAECEERHAQSIAKALCNWNYNLPTVFSPL